MEVSPKSDNGVDEAIKTLVYDLEDMDDISTLVKKTPHVQRSRQILLGI